MIIKVLKFDTLSMLSFLVKENSMRDLVAQVINGDTEKLTEVIEAQCEGGNILRSLRSR